MRYIRAEKMGIELTIFYPVAGGKDFEEKMKGDSNATLYKNEKKGIESIKNIMG